MPLVVRWIGTSRGALAQIFKKKLVCCFVRYIDGKPVLLSAKNNEKSMIGRVLCVGASSEPRTGPSAAHGSPFLWSVSAPGHRKSPFMVLRDRAKVQGTWGGRGVRGKAHGA